MKTHCVGMVCGSFLSSPSGRRVLLHLLTTALLVLRFRLLRLALLKQASMSLLLPLSKAVQRLLRRAPYYNFSGVRSFKMLRRLWRGNRPNKWDRGLRQIRRAGAKRYSLGKSAGKKFARSSVRDTKGYESIGGQKNQKGSTSIRAYWRLEMKKSLLQVRESKHGRRRFCQATPAEDDSGHQLDRLAPQRLEN